MSGDKTNKPSTRLSVKIPSFPALLFVALALFCGCASSSNNNLKFTAYKESDVFTGKGGEEYPVDGIDFWTSGEPGRKYQILGILEASHGRHGGHHHGRLAGLFSSDHSGDDPDDQIAKAAKKNGGDAVIVVHENQNTTPIATDTDTEYTASEHHHAPTRYAVIKYVP